MLPRAEQWAGPAHNSTLSTLWAAHKSSHAPKKRLQTEAAGHQPCNNSLLQNHFLLLKQSQWPAWSLKQMGWIQQEEQGRVFGGCLVFGGFFLQQKEVPDWQRPALGLEEEWKRETTDPPTHGHVQVSYSQENRKPGCKSLKLSKIPFWWELRARSRRALREIGRQRDKSAPGSPGEMELGRNR